MLVPRDAPKRVPEARRESRCPPSESLARAVPARTRESPPRVPVSTQRESSERRPGESPGSPPRAPEAHSARVRREPFQRELERARREPRCPPSESPARAVPVRTRESPPRVPVSTQRESSESRSSENSREPAESPRAHPTRDRRGLYLERSCVHACIHLCTREYTVVYTRVYFPLLGSRCTPRNSSPREQMSLLGV